MATTSGTSCRSSKCCPPHSFIILRNYLRETRLSLVSPLAQGGATPNPSPWPQRRTSIARIGTEITTHAAPGSGGVAVALVVAAAGARAGAVAAVKAGTLATATAAALVRMHVVCLLGSQVLRREKCAQVPAEDTECRQVHISNSPVIAMGNNWQPQLATEKSPMACVYLYCENFTNPNKIKWVGMLDSGKIGIRCSRKHHQQA